MSHVVVTVPGQRRLWSAARWAAIGAVPLLLAWLLWRPEAALTTLWYLVVPILPATFFLTPALWRGICPLATLNEWGNRIGRPRPLPTTVATALGVGGLVLFHLMVPARRFLFNEQGPVLAATIAAVGALALLLGALFEVRSAFCNALCPVLPVELLYGQQPLVRVTRGRCATCTTCTPRGCIDLAQSRALPQVLGVSRRSAAWLAHPFGLFWAALPGFIIGYGLLTDGPLASAPTVYLTTLGGSLLSVAVVAVAVLTLRIPTEMALVLVAAAAGMAYYWFAGPTISRELGAGIALSHGIRGLGIGLVAFWLWRSLAGRGKAGELQSA
ncbi:MAG: hypothetical protein SFV24_14800 [Gemmatimonadales bacterium]|nr:hypothetical protein [Gemmatimonadales bacterium]